MQRDIAKKIAHVYQERRFRSADMAAARREDILRGNPDLKEIEDRLTGANARIAAEIMADGKPRTGSEERDRILLERRRYLSEHGIPENYDRAEAFCPHCQDTGFLSGPGGRRCGCYNRLLVPLLFEYSNFGDLARFTFDQFDGSLFSSEPDPGGDENGSSPRERIERLRNAAGQFIRDFDTPGTPGLFFIGRPGTGKTFLAGCIANELIRDGKFVLYLSAPDLYGHIGEYRMLRNAYAPDRERLEKAETTYDSIMNCDLLILDDLGTEAYGPDRQPELLAVMNHRSGRGGKMIITTNLDMEHLMDFYDERVISRIYGNFSVFKFTGGDLRLALRRQKRANGRE